MELSKETLLLLEDIERRIDPETEEDLEKQWLDFTYGRFEGEIFCPNRKKLSVPSVEPPFININDAIKDYDLMLRGQLAGVSGALNGTHNTLCIRANYGTGIMTSLFGAEIFIMPYENNTLPTTRPLNDSEKIRRIVEKDGYDIMSGFGKNVFEFGEICAEVFEKYPKILLINEWEIDKIDYTTMINEFCIENSTITLPFQEVSDSLGEYSGVEVRKKFVRIIHEMLGEKS